MNIHFLAVLAAALSAFLIGGVWYMMLFAKKWQKLVGLTDRELRQGRPKVFLLSFLLTLIMAFNLAAFLGPDTDWKFGLFGGLAAGLGWVALAFGVTYLFERRPLALFFINAGYFVVTFTVMGLILGLM